MTFLSLHTFIVVHIQTQVRFRNGIALRHTKHKGNMVNNSNEKIQVVPYKDFEMENNDGVGIYNRQ